MRETRSAMSSSEPRCLISSPNASTRSDVVCTVLLSLSSLVRNIAVPSAALSCMSSVPLLLSLETYARRRLSRDGHVPSFSCLRVVSSWGFLCSRSSVPASW